ncbi:Uma2 family endonuclease [Embleya sp. NBC_00896]|uniref:Uma2 family endonuclease n=1 Tax=Embleya sp. NBC_00896 TaxID=2975961 RepID=UPI00386FF342|nr:Uma2 family endonuclease [Embleya sp. NBC_00896]
MAIAMHEPHVTASEFDALDDVLWQAWSEMTVPEGLRAEIIEGAIEVSPTGSRRHGKVANRLRDALRDHLASGDSLSAYQDINVICRRKVYIPDVCVAPEDLDEAPDPDGLGVASTGVVLVAEIVSPGREAGARDRERKRRAYAEAGIGTYVIVDDFDESGIVTVLSEPDVAKGVYQVETRVAYGIAVSIPDGPVKGFAIGPEITTN